MKQIDLIAGARPNFMKIAPIIDALNAAETRAKVIPLSSDPYRPTFRPRHILSFFEMT